MKITLEKAIKKIKDDGHKYGVTFEFDKTEDRSSFIITNKRSRKVNCNVFYNLVKSLIMCMKTYRSAPLPDISKCNSIHNSECNLPGFLGVPARDA